MLKKIIHKIAKAHHPWRVMKFDELAEIYASMSIRSFGFGIIGIFVPIYLYQNSYTIQDIFFFYSLFFIFRLPIAYICAFLVGRIGPKHSIAVSTLVLVVFLFMLLTLDLFGWPIYGLALVYTITNGLFFLAYNTDFSKIKDTKHGGKELSWLYIFEKTGAALGPLFGGIIASIIAPEITIAVAMIALLGSLVPLFLTNEPVRTHQRITFKNFRWRRHVRDYISVGSHSIDITSTQILWPLFIALTIFTDKTYASIGILTAFALSISIITAKKVGQLVDQSKGYYLLNFGVFMNLLFSIFRSITSSIGGAVAVAISHEPISLTYSIPIVKGYFDGADSEEGYRIVYLTIGEITTAIFKSVFFLILFISCFYFEPIQVLKYSFVFAGILSTGMLLQRFPSLKKV